MDTLAMVRLIQNLSKKNE